MAISERFYTQSTLALARVIYESDNEEERLEAIDSIVDSSEQDKSRLLIEIFRAVVWRETLSALLRAIGKSKESRGVEFLIRFIRESQDLPLATQAVLGLGYSQTSLAGEFLLSLLNRKGSRLRQEAIVGLALMPHFSCDEQLVDIIENEDAEDTLALFAIIAAGRRGSQMALPAIMNIVKTHEGKLFNAAVLALGHLGQAQHIDDMCQRDTSYQLFADELKLYAKDRSRMRAGHKVEDLVIGVLSDKQLDWCTSFRLLREFPAKDVWSTIEVFQDELDSEMECLLRATTHRAERAEEDIQFLIENQHTLHISHSAILARLCIASVGETFLEKLEPLYVCELFEQVYTPSILHFSDQYFLPNENEELTIAFINAVVSQGFMTIDVNAQLINFLLDKLSVVDSSAIFGRILRGLAQLGCEDIPYLKILCGRLGDKKESASAYYCLSLLPSKISTHLLTDRLRELLDGQPNVDDESTNIEITEIVRRLAGNGRISEAKLLSNIPRDVAICCHMELMQILRFNKIEGYEWLIEEQLVGGHYSEQLLAVSAMAMNGSRSLNALLLPLLESDNSALRERAIHSLCLGGTVEQHVTLFQWFESKAFSSTTASKILSTLSPEKGGDYSQLVSMLDRLIRLRQGPFVDDDVVAEAFSLHDMLMMLSTSQASEMLVARRDNHAQDETLAKEIVGYHRFSETIKIILRNAELTWHHSDLFNDYVDKSTMLVQYSKSTDLLLQQRLGQRLFNQNETELLPLLQGRIMELGLDNAVFSQVKMLKLLKLEGFFTTKEFPAHRLKKLSYSIMSGKIMTDRFRAIDGLRAWSLILLLFARTFEMKGKVYTPLFTMRNSSEETINGIVLLMNRFQDLRNSAAHHGIVVEPELLARIRADSFKLFNELDAVLCDAPSAENE